MSIIFIIYTYQRFKHIHDNGSNNKLFDTKIIVVVMTSIVTTVVIITMIMRIVANTYNICLNR